MNLVPLSTSLDVTVPVNCASINLLTITYSLDLSTSKTQTMHRFYLNAVVEKNRDRDSPKTA